MRWLLAKDLRILQRSPVLLGTLVIYPIVIALLIGFAISSPPGRPRVAVYSGVKAGHGTIAFGSQRISLSKYANQLYSSIEPLPAASPQQARADVRDGRALAALIIPANIDQQIQQLIETGDGNPTVQIVLNDRNPLERDLVQQAIQARVDDVQTAVSRQLMKLVITDLQKVLSGGKVSFLGHTISLLGLRGVRAIVQTTIDSLPKHSTLRPALAQVADFANIAIDGLALASPQIGGVATPLTIQESDVSGATTPTSSYAIAIAVVVLLMFVTLLLAAGMLALERSENAYRRLVRGLVRPELLLAEKIVLASACALAMTLAMSAVISIFVPLDWGRFALWLLALAVGGIAFSALGVTVGALARDVSVASLLAFLISLPVAFVALVPSTSVSSALNSVLSVISFVFPFRAALDAVSNAFTGSRPAIALPLLHLVVLAAAFALLARVALLRFGER
ncbi:MAG TPA: ABC transporter permease [Solirubrobacteraceae bacterium]|nr:ABC transporter permease [Solirubrobacteraceae bacterium]